VAARRRRARGDQQDRVQIGGSAGRRADRRSRAGGRAGAHLADETARPVARAGHTRIVATRHGFVLASAGHRRLQCGPLRLVLLPLDPDASARSLRAALRTRLGLDVAVIITDTMGRPWRQGLMDLAIGAAGIDALRDHRGEVDAYGNELHITQMAVIDELSSAAELVKGKVRPGARWRWCAGSWPAHGRRRAGAAVLVRDAAHDLFSLGTAEAGRSAWPTRPGSARRRRSRTSRPTRRGGPCRRRTWHRRSASEPGSPISPIRCCGTSSPHVTASRAGRRVGAVHRRRPVHPRRWTCTACAVRWPPRAGLRLATDHRGPPHRCGPERHLDEARMVLVGCRPGAADRRPRLNERLAGR
jgi:coenzyme F420-0:L-glutamate ligase